VGLPEGGNGSCSKTCVVSSDDAHKVVRIKTEEDTDECVSCNDTCLASSIVAHEFVNIKVEEETDEHGSYSEIYLTPDDAHEGVSVKADDCINVKVEEDTDDSCSEACLTSSDDTHEIVSIKVEADTDLQEGNESESVAFPVIPTEPEVRQGHCCVWVFCVCVCVCVHVVSVGGLALCMGSQLFCEWWERENMINFKYPHFKLRQINKNTLDSPDNCAVPLTQAFVSQPDA